MCCMIDVARSRAVSRTLKDGGVAQPPFSHVGGQPDSDGKLKDQEEEDDRRNGLYNRSVPFSYHRRPGQTLEHSSCPPTGTTCIQ